MFTSGVASERELAPLTNRRERCWSGRALGAVVSFTTTRTVVGVSWFEVRVAEPARAVLDQLSVGERLRDLDEVDLALGIEGLFRQEAPNQFDGWPPESTTDGVVVDVCARTQERVVEMAGRMFIDFDGDQFPFRAVVSVNADGPITVDVFIGDVDAATGQPPRLPGDALVLAVEDRVDLTIGRRQAVVRWTPAFSYGGPRCEK